MILFFYLMTCISNHCSMRTPLQQLFRMIVRDGCHFKCELINVSKSFYETYNKLQPSQTGLL